MRFLGIAMHSGNGQIDNRILIYPNSPVNTRLGFMYSDPHRMSAFTANLASSVCGKTLPIVTGFTIQRQSENS